MKIRIPDSKKLVHGMHLPIRWGDIDAMGHSNNTSYFRYMETIRIEWMHSIGCQPDPGGEGPVIVNAFCNFLKQLQCPGNVLIKMYVSDLGRTAFETWVTLERADEPGTTYAAGGATTIWVNFLAQKAKTVPDWLRLHTLC